MLKKFLAGLTAIALSLGMVALTAGPASAHSNNISATVACNTGPDGYWKVTWTVANDYGSDATINTADRTTAPALVGAVIPANSSLQFVEYFTTQPASNVTLNINSTWAGDNYNRDNSETINKNKFDDDCIPDDTDKKVDICHYDNGQGGKWTTNNVSVSSIITGPNGHAFHVNDIIPPFTYVKQGVNGSYPGLNWDAYGQWVYQHGCSKDVTPTKPVTTQAVCIAEGQVGGAGYTIPAANVFYYYEESTSTNGPWTTAAPGNHPVSDGTFVWIRAVAYPGYDLAGNDANYKWKLEFTDVDATTCVTPAAPTPTYQVCTRVGAPTQAMYTIPNDSGIQYQLWNGAQWVNVSAGDVNVNSFPTTIQLQAVAKPGFTLVGAPTSWTFQFTAAGPCLIDATPVAPSFTDAICVPTAPGTTDGYYVINAADHVVYEVQINGGGWNVVDPNTYGDHIPTSQGDLVEVRVSPASGYTLVGGNQGPWTHVFINPGNCLDDATPVEPTFTDAICVDPGTGTTGGYYIVNGTNGDHVVYEVQVNSGGWNVVNPNTYGTQVPTTAGDLIEIRATAASGYKLVGNAQGPWSHTFANPGDCLDAAAAGDPVFVNATCDINGLTVAGYYVVIAGSHVTYEVSLDSTDGVNGTWAPVNPATYGNHIPTSPGDHVWVRAIADSGYKLDPNAVHVWNHLFTAPFGCLDTEGPVDPVVTFVQTTCQVAGKYTLGVADIGNEAGVVWTVTGGLPATIGTHSVSTPGKVTVTAQPAPGWGFTGNPPLVNGIPTLTWEFTFASLPDDCLPTLAFTGGSVAGGALGLSALLTLGGILLLAARRREQADTSV